MMSEPQDRELSRIYKDAETSEPPHRVDEAILAASRRAAGSKPRPAWSERLSRSRVPLALAATILLSFTVTLMVSQDSREIDSGPLAKTPGSVEERAEATPSTLSKARSAPRTDTGRDREAESLASAEGSDASRPGFVHDAPSAPARAAPGPLGKGQRAQGAPEPGEARAARESTAAAAQAVPSAPPAPAAAASPRRETALQRADAASGQAGGVADREAKERQPEKWIEDIRRLKAQGKTDEAGRELAEFKKRYPQHRLPDDLR